MLTSINTRNSQSSSKESFSELSQQTQHLVADLQAKIHSLQEDVKSSTESIVSHPYIYKILVVWLTELEDSKYCQIRPECSATRISQYALLHSSDCQQHLYWSGHRFR